MLPFALSPRLIGMAAGALAVAIFVVMALHWRSQRNELREWQAQVVAATRDAADNPKLGKAGVAQQIVLLGKSIADLRTGIANQNAAINAQAAETKRQQIAAAKASDMAKERAARAEATANRLSASSRAGGPPCEPSDALKGSWQ